MSASPESEIVASILKTLPNCDRWCCEFGAWDGIHLSNTRDLIVGGGYSAVLIEGSPSKAAELRANYHDRPQVIPMQAFVGFTAADGLDSLLRPTPIPRDFDFLSIDVDGNDWHIWRAIEHYRPKLVCIEFNPTIPTEVRFVQPADPAVSQGASLLSLVELGREKGYELAAATAGNAFFVTAELFPLLGIRDNRPETLRTDLFAVTYIFSGYDGSVHLAGHQRLLWHHLPMRVAWVQQLPAWLRKFPPNYRPWQWWLFRLWSRFRGR
jgi:hypothetical protein